MPFGEKLVPVLDDLVGAAYQVHIVPVQEFGHHVGAEGEGNPAIVLPPPLNVLVRIGPEQVAEQTRVRHVRRPHDPPDLLHRLEIRRKAAVAAEDLVVDDGGDRQAVEAVREGFPQPDAETFFALLVKTVDAWKEEDGGAGQ